MEGNISLIFKDISRVLVAILGFSRSLDNLKYLLEDVFAKQGKCIKAFVQVIRFTSCSETLNNVF